MQRERLVSCHRRALAASDLAVGEPTFNGLNTFTLISERTVLQSANQFPALPRRVTQGWRLTDNIFRAGINWKFWYESAFFGAVHQNPGQCSEVFCLINAWVADNGLLQVNVRCWTSRASNVQLDEAADCDDAPARVASTRARNVQTVPLISRRPISPGQAPASIFASMKPEPAPAPAPGQVEAPTM